MKIKNLAFIVSVIIISTLPAFAQVGNPSTPSSSQQNLTQAQFDTVKKMQKEFKMTKKDFMAQVENTFEGMDKNHDGVLTMDELTGSGKGNSSQIDKMVSPPPSPIPVVTPTPSDQPPTAPTNNTEPAKSIPPASSIPAVGGK